MKILKNENEEGIIVMDKKDYEIEKEQKKIVFNDSIENTKVLIIIILIFICIIGLIGYFLYKEYQNKDDTDMYITYDIDDEYDPEDENIIGYLTIESIDLIEVPIAEGTDEDTVLNYYIGHFETSDYLEGNVALAAHNRGYDNNYFENLKNVEIGAEIIYETEYETKTYTVDTISQILETDVDVVYSSQENKITLITCVENEPDYRLCVVGLEDE